MNYLKLAFLTLNVLWRKLKKILSRLDEFCESIEFENFKNGIEGNVDEELETIIAEIKKIKTSALRKTEKQDEITKKQVLG